MGHLSAVVRFSRREESVCLGPAAKKCPFANSRVEAVRPLTAQLETKPAGSAVH